jgi:hypothetical protein
LILGYFKFRVACFYDQFIWLSVSQYQNIKVSKYPIPR